ncbi:MAG TPA: hypothetical protein VHB21_11770, partial [Minicystis sp.]|nr:hypothetical protein [Minicystis sp.]
MDLGSSFRRALAARLVTLVGVAALGTACSTSIDSGGSGGAGGSSSGQGGTSHTTSTGTSMPADECFRPMPTPNTCPPTSDQNLTSELMNPCQNGSFYPYQQENATPDAQGRCCYKYECALGTGRPYLVDDGAVQAPVARRLGWGSPGLAPDVRGLGRVERAALAAAWARDGAMEHASIASFGRFALELLALGAPAELVEDAHRAAIDEARHARLCFALASGYAGERVGPGAFPFGGAVDVATDLAALARAVVREG